LGYRCCPSRKFRKGEEGVNVLRGLAVTNIHADLALLFNELNTRLRDKTDDLLKAYEGMQPDFANVYFGARRKS
jgi:hypothetical protein